MNKVSIILPLYRQSKQVNKLIEIYSLIRQRHKSVNEIIFVVNNGDETTHRAIKKIQDDFFKVLFVSDGGWGKGIKEGVNHANGNWILYTNSARTHFDDLNRFLNESKFVSNQLYKACRKSRGMLRKMISKIMELEFAFFSGIHQTDINGTPKLLEKELFQNLDLIEDNVFIDSELTLKVRSRGLFFQDIPFYNYQRLEGKSTTSSKMIFSFMIRLPKKVRLWKSQI